MIRHEWLLIVVITAGLLGMHHLLVCTEQTTPMTIATGPGSSPVMVPSTSVTPILPADRDLAGTNPVEASLVVTSQADCCYPMDMVRHVCLAVLTAITALVAALIVAVARSRAAEPGQLLVDVSTVAARAPPIGCARRTQLCVLRR